MGRNDSTTGFKKALSHVNHEPDMGLTMKHQHDAAKLTNFTRQNTRNIAAEKYEFQESKRLTKKKPKSKAKGTGGKNYSQLSKLVGSGTDR